MTAPQVLQRNVGDVFTFESSDGKYRQRLLVKAIDPDGTVRCVQAPTEFPQIYTWPVFDGAEPEPPAAWRPVIEPLEFLRYPMPARWPQYPMWPVSPWMKLMLREVARSKAASVIISPQMLDHLHDPGLRMRQWIDEILGGARA